MAAQGARTPGHHARDLRLKNVSVRDAPARGAAQHATCVSDALMESLAALGVSHAFGVNGGGIAGLYHAIATSSIRLVHCRHETGAGYQATEAALASGRPTLVFATTGPGLLNSLTGMAAARCEGAKVILVSGCTNAEQRGRWAVQETSPYTLPQDVFYTAGPVFDFAVRMEHAAELPQILHRLALGLAQPAGFVAHVAIPMRIQRQIMDRPPCPAPTVRCRPAPSARDLAQVVAELRCAPFAIWAGFGARAAGPQIARLAERSGAPMISTPRGKGIVPEDHPLFLGVSGLGGDACVRRYLVEHKPDWLLVLGTRLGEPTSFWDESLLPARGVIHVDLDPAVPGSAYASADVRTIAVQADIAAFLEGLNACPLSAMRAAATSMKLLELRAAAPPLRTAPPSDAVSPRALLAAIQRRIVDASDALLMAEAGNAFAWATHCLRFREPRYRVSTQFGAMGHFTAGVVGAALASGKKAVALVGDGAMLMHSEISSAATYGAPAVWIVLNDGGYGMSADGLRFLGLSDAELRFPRADFVQVARGMGADGVRVCEEHALDAALDQAMQAPGPFVVDVRIEVGGEPSPLLARFDNLSRQGAGSDLAGWSPRTGSGGSPR
jgi:acetolactate synthase I/II/III large subunit